MFGIASFSQVPFASLAGNAFALSITDNNTGDYTVNFTTAMPDVNYCPLVVQGNDNTGNSGVRGANVLATQVAPTTSAVRVGTWSSSGARSSEDSAYVFVGVTR
jgi:hypothetical protein